MRKIFLIIALFTSLPLYSQWLPNGNNMKLDTKGDKVNDFVISEDSKFIYTLGDSGVISKYDAGSGERVWRKKVEADSGSQLDFNQIFLSEDAKTYCIAFYKKSDGSMMADSIQYISIYKIDDDSIIGKITGIINNSNSEGFIFNCLNFNYNKNIMLLSYANGYYHDNGVIESSLSSGNVEILNSADKFKINKIDLDSAKPFLVKANNNYNMLFVRNEYFEEMFISPYGYGGKTTKYKNLLYDLNSDTTYDITNFSVVKNADSINPQKGTYQPFEYCFFSLDGKYMFLSFHNQIYKYSLSPVNLIQYGFISKYPSNINIGMFESAQNNYFYLTRNNELDVHKIADFNFCKNIIFTNCNKINKLVNTPDSKDLYLSDDSNNLMKISNDTIFKLHANFATEDTIYIQTNTIHFMDCSLGDPVAFYWDFGDGFTSNLQNPSHKYGNTGIYNIKLIVNKGKRSDTVYKQKYIEIIPELKPAFSYTKSGAFPITVNYYDASQGTIDSLKWDFGDNTFDTSSNPIKNYFYSGSYGVTLTIYSKTKVAKLTKFVPINVVPSRLDENKFQYETFDKIHNNYIAVKGYETENTNLICQVQRSDTNFISLLSNNDTIWNIKMQNKSAFVRKNNGKNIYYHNDTLTHVFLDGSVTVTNPAITKSNYLFFNMKTYNNNLCISQQGQYNYLKLIDDNDSVVKIGTPSLLYEPYVSYMKYTNYSLNIVGFIDSLRYDFCRSNRIDIYDTDYKKHYFFNLYIVNNRSLNTYRSNIDLLRLNDSILITSGYNYMDFFVDYGVSNDTLNHFPNTNYLRDSIRWDNYVFHSLLKLNDTAFAVAGSYRGSPMVMIFNDKGNVLDSVTLSDRFGEFEFVSLTPDNKLLLSGYRYMTFGVMSPYFVKFGDDILADLLPKSGTTPDKRSNANFTAVSYPNPTNGVVTLKFNLPAPGAVKLTVYDTFGQNVISCDDGEYSLGDNTINFDLSQFSAGYYYYTLETSFGRTSGKIVNVR